MKRNMSNTDKMLRVLIAAAIGLLYYFNIVSGVLGAVLAVVAIILLVTAFVNFCPLYKLFGVCTFRPKQKGL